MGRDVLRTRLLIRPAFDFAGTEMEAQKRKAQQRAWEKQEKMIKALKASGQSKNKAEQTAKNKSRETGGAKKKKGDAVATGQEAQDTKELIER